MTDQFYHKTVLLEEAVDGLHIIPDGIYVDCTLGGAGHSQAILKQLNEQGHLYAFDQDHHAIEHARDVLSPYIEKNQVTLIQDNFVTLTDALAQYGVHQVQGIVYDLGVSSPQLDEAMRGFSYHQDAPLDMRMNQDQSFSAEDVVNTYSYEALVRIFTRYGEEKYAKSIARAIERERAHRPIKTTQELVDLIKIGIPARARRTGGHPAKRVFQAIRIEVNQELAVLEDSLEQAIDLLAPGGYLSVITFHSLEDRLVKQMFRSESTPKETPPGLPVIPDSHLPRLRLVTKKPIAPTEEEIRCNPRSRSAKLRIVQKMTS